MRGNRRVALISPYPVPGVSLDSGVEWYTRRLAAALADAGAEVTVVAQRAHGQPEWTKDGSVSVRRSWRRGPWSLPTAARAAVELDPDATHLQYEVFLYGGAEAVPGLPMALALLRRRRRRPVVTLHQVVDPNQVDTHFVELHRVKLPPLLARTGLGLLQGTCRRLARPIVHEHSFAEVVRGATVIPLGVDPQPAPERAEVSQQLGLDRTRFVVLCFGFVSPYKGLEAALEAAQRAGPELQLVIAGGDHPRLAGRDGYAAELQARYGDTARFTGFVPEAEVPAWFAAADMVLIPYPRPFSSSGALSLALGLGRPVLLSTAMAEASGAPPVTAVDIQPASMAARLLELARSPAARAELAAASAALAAQRDWGSVARRHLELYEEVTDDPRDAGGARGAA